MAPFNSLQYKSKPIAFIYPCCSVPRILPAPLISRSFMAILKPEVVTLTDNKAVFRCTDCPTQTARIRDGKGFFPGNSVCLAVYKAYAEVIDPRIKVSCLLACPSDVQPSQYWCEWQVEI